jgi:hypothetical protein
VEITALLRSPRAICCLLWHQVRLAQGKLCGERGGNNGGSGLLPRVRCAALFRRLPDGTVLRHLSVDDPRTFSAPGSMPHNFLGFALLCSPVAPVQALFDRVRVPTSTFRLENLS